MTLVLVVKTPEGLVLAAESRTTLTVTDKESKKEFQSTYDHAIKLLTFDVHDYVGVVTYGQATIGLRTPHAYLLELEEYLGLDKLTIYDFAEKLSGFFTDQRKKVEEKSTEKMRFIVAGFDEDEEFGRIYLVEIPPDEPESHPVEILEKQNFQSMAVAIQD